MPVSKIDHVVEVAVEDDEIVSQDWAVDACIQVPAAFITPSHNPPQADPE